MSCRPARWSRHRIPAPVRGAADDLLAKGYARQTAGDVDGAIADCNKSIALDPSSPLPYYNRGFARANIGDHAGAIADWTKAIEMQPAYRAELEQQIETSRRLQRQR